MGQAQVNVGRKCERSRINRSGTAAKHSQPRRLGSPRGRCSMSATFRRTRRRTESQKDNLMSDSTNTNEIMVTVLGSKCLGHADGRVAIRSIRRASIAHLFISKATDPSFFVIRRQQKCAQAISFTRLIKCMGRDGCRLQGRGRRTSVPWHSSLVDGRGMLDAHGLMKPKTTKAFTARMPRLNAE